LENARMIRTLFATFLVLASCASVRSETPEEWIALGTRVHGGFGVLIPIGIRIGLDAVERLKPEPRGLTVAYLSGERAPCACIVDGIMLATRASPGQGTINVADGFAPAGIFASIIIRNRKTGERVKYTLGDALGPQVV